MDGGRKLLIDFNAGKIQIVSFDLPNNSCTINVKMVCSQGKIIFKDAGAAFLF